MQTVLNVKGMKCGGCENSIQTAILACPGVASVKASFRDNSVEIDFDETQVTLDALRKVIADQGFQLS